MLFAYRCAQRDGSERDGLLEAVDESAARFELSQRGWRVLRLSPVEGVRRTTRPVARARAPEPPRAAARPRVPAGPAVRLSLGDLCLLTSQLSTLCGAGVSIHRAFEVVGQAAPARLRSVCQHLTNCLQGGARISEALSSLPRTFGPVLVSLVRVGEETGRMVPILAALSDSLARELRGYQRLASALAYPLFALTACAGLLALLAGVMLPQVLPLLPARGELPWATRLLLALDLRLPLAVLGTLLVLGLAAARTAEGAVAVREWLYGFAHPRRALWARLARSLALMLASGMKATAALRALREPTSGSSRVDEALVRVEQGVENGLSLAQALAGCPQVPRALVRLLVASEEVGRPEQFLESYSELCELQLEGEREAFLSLLEPAIVLGMGMTVGFVVTAVFLPLYGSLV